MHDSVQPLAPCSIRLGPSLMTALREAAASAAAAGLDGGIHSEEAEVGTLLPSGGDGGDVGDDVGDGGGRGPQHVEQVPSHDGHSVQ